MGKLGLRRMEVELRHLRAFVAIARAGSITAAARELSITQPALSRTLRALESAVGVRLVERTTTSLRLSPAGRAMLPRADAALAAMADALQGARQAVWPLRVGHPWSAAGPRTAQIVREWTATHPDVPVELIQLDDRYAGLTRRLVDVAVLRGVPTPDGAESVVLETERRVAVFAADHRLAAAAELSMADLTGERLVINASTGTVTPALWPGPERPDVGPRVTSLEDWLFAVAAGQGIGVTAASTAELHAQAGLVFVPLRDAPPMTVSLAWLTSGGHAARAEFARHALAVMSEGAG
jgi:DNA-binding transcriptional LysR family regulator